LGLTDQGNFRHALFSVFESLARKIVLDGEGATKFVEIAVEGARSREMAKNVGRFVGNSSLVKTAIFGQDPNWGRILSSAGSSGEDIDGDAIDIWLDNVPVVRQSMALHYDRAQLKEIVSRDTYQIRINLNIGDAGFKVWISDLSYEYVRINAEYST
jgi:glutamate N-acetyltransferase/amino-acid N-acetyltransferase